MVSTLGKKESIPKVSIRQLKAARALLLWSQEDLSEHADVSVPTIKRLESKDGPLGGYQDTREKLISALQRGGVEFLDENGGGAGVRLRRQTAKRPPG